MAPGCYTAASAVTTAPRALAPCTSNLRSSTLQLKATPAFQLTQTKNLGVIPVFPFCQIPHPVQQQIIWALLSKHFQICLLFATSSAITLSQPPSSSIILLQKPPKRSPCFYPGPVRHPPPPPPALPSILSCNGKSLKHKSNYVTSLHKALQRLPSQSRSPSPAMASVVLPNPAPSIF